MVAGSWCRALAPDSEFGQAMRERGAEYPEGRHDLRERGLGPGQAAEGMRKERPSQFGWLAIKPAVCIKPRGLIQTAGLPLCWRAKGVVREKGGLSTSEAGGEAEKGAGKGGGGRGKTSEAGGVAEKQQGAYEGLPRDEATGGGAVRERSSRKTRRGRAAGVVKNRGSFVVQLSNITYWSAKAKSWAGAQQSDVQIIVEHHLLPLDLDKGCSYLKTRDWRCFASAAERSEGGEGTVGGTLVAAHAQYDARPVAGATATSSGWRCKPCTPFAAATQITLGGRQVIIMGGYCRGGIDSVEAGEVMRTWQHLTSSGDILYIAGADFNVHPSVLRNSLFLESVKGVVIASNSATCTGAAGEGNELDYFIVHRDLAPNVLSCSRDWAVLFGPHATVRLEMCFQQHLMSKLVFRMPKVLPEGHLGVIEEATWTRCRSEAGLWVRRQRRLEGVATEPAVGNGLDEEEKVDERPGDDEVTAKASELSRDYWLWCNALERAVLDNAKTPRSQWDKYMGRGAPPTLVAVKIGQDREGPSSAIKVESNQSAAGRLVATWQILVKNIGRRPEVEIWKTTLKGVIFGHEDEVSKLVALVGQESFVRLVRALRKIAVGQASDMEIASAAGRLGAVEKLVQRRGAEERTAAQAEWRREALSGGAREAHRFANSPNCPRQVDQCTLLRECLPSALAREQSEVWGAKWHCNEVEEVKEYSRHMKDLRQWALDQRGLFPEAFAEEEASWQLLLTPANLVVAAASFKARTGIGTDNVAFQLVKQAPARVLEDLGDLFKRVLNELIWPSEQTFTLLHLIPKKVGYRTVGTLTTFVRLLMRLLGPNFRRWDESHAYAFDSAAPGQRADDHVWARQATLEAWASSGRQIGQILWDIASFYEEIKPADLVQDMKDTKFPASEGALSLLNHGGKRILAVDGALGSVLPAVGRSIVTGCTSSTSLARAFMVRPLANLVEVQAQSKLTSGADLRCSIHVDDLAVFGAASSEESLIEGLKDVCTVFVEDMRSRGMQISSKTVILMPKRSLGLRLQSYLQKRFGLSVLVEETGAALGIEVSANYRVRRTKLQKARFSKAGRRSARGGWLVAKDQRATRLFASGSAPMAEYGATTNGLSPAYLDRLDSMAARAAGANGFSPCSTSLTFFHLGFVPSVKAIGKQASSWIRNWSQADAATRSLWTRGWQQIRDVLTVVPAEDRWRRVTSPISATIASLLHIGWSPVQPSHWLAVDRSFQAIIGRGSWEDSQIVKAIEEEAELLAWRRASSRGFAAEELAQGPPCWEGVRRAAKKLRKLGLGDSVQGLHKVAVGGGVFGERLFLKQSCDRCGAEVETPEHRYYSCPANANIVGEVERTWLLKSEWLVEAVNNRAAPERLLWCRGVLPFNRSGRLAVPGAGEDEVRPVQWAVGSNEHVNFLPTDGCCLYTDGSGGGVAPFPCLQRAGAGAVWFGLTPDGKADLSAEGWAKFGAVAVAVPGRQTVPRAEVWAGVAAAEQEAAGGGRPMSRWVVDARYVQSGVASMMLSPGKRRSSNGKDFGARPNNDLWQEVETKISSGSLPAATWMKSHQTLGEVASGTLSIEDYLGNALADALAGTAAELAQVPSIVLIEAEKQLTLSFFVCMRIAIIEFAVKKFKEETVLNYLVKGKVQQVSKARAADEAAWNLEDTGHVLTGHGSKFLRCAGCGNIRPQADWTWWRNNSCTGFGQIFELEAEQPEEVIVDNYEGKLPDFLIFKRKRQEMDEVTKRRNNRRRKEATARLFAEKAKVVPPASWQGGEAAGPQPIWAAKLDPSHLLFFAGGGVFCTKCGAANGRARKGKLHKICSGHLATGSEWRVQGLMLGKCTAWPQWPDGRGKHVRVATAKVDVGLQGLNRDLSEAVAKELGVGVNLG